LQKAYAKLRGNVFTQYGVELTSIAAMGFSAMMHGYMALDKNGELLVPFRTWRNTITGQAARILTERFQFNIPQRWSIAHLYQAILNDEEHVKDIRCLTTLAGYVHYSPAVRQSESGRPAACSLSIRTGDYDTQTPSTPWWLRSTIHGKYGRFCRRFSTPASPPEPSPQRELNFWTLPAFCPLAFLWLPLKETRVLAWLLPTLSFPAPAMCPQVPVCLL
ncbi:MAG: hypothetical protein ACLVKN_21460, partial [Flavonifractor plautii]